MSPKKPSPSVVCSHPCLLIKPHPSQSQFSRVSPSRRAAATTSSSTQKTAITDTILHEFASDLDCASTFPGPLVLEGDDLAIDPKQGGQTFGSWEKGKHRNLVPEAYETRDSGKRKRGARRMIYVMGPPEIDGEGVEGFMRGWDECEAESGSKKGKGSKNMWKEENWEMSDWMSDIISYLQAFYHGLPVKRLDSSLLHFTPWEDTSPQTSKCKFKSTSRKKFPTYIFLRTSTFKTGIRFRSTPYSPFKHQLNLSDLLDLAIDILPEDAYALLMLVNHDLYEDDDDEFICGRAYGGSRVAVVSTARYNPVLDELQNVQRVHAWPGSHCAEYADGFCRDRSKKDGKRTRAEADGEYAMEGSPLALAVTQQNTLLSLSSSPDISSNILPGLYLSRICRTASHELGHCFGIDHCIYYACCMQGSASIIEDSRQPPYLCPVDLAKVICATGADVEERYEVLLKFCERHGDVHMLVAFGEWIRGRLGQIRKLEMGKKEE
ncbi:hypothetical protein EYC80_000223 [Monilinia laxa]|uniref:Uncharacterized protein n=1 Tax=Monilinia laxa TaxID=61186 RepID=A0A5N6KA28_MONLA|nr:hypothetical protein EYC80_000223 [Monilinia laxa]